VASIHSHLSNLQRAIAERPAGDGGAGGAGAAAAPPPPLSSAEAAAVGSRAPVAAASLAPGANPGVYLRLRFLRAVPKGGAPPSCFVAADECGAAGAPPVAVTSLHVAEDFVRQLVAEERGAATRVLVVDPVCVRGGGAAGAAYEAVHAPRHDGLVFNGKFISRRVVEANAPTLRCAFGGGAS
jgi:hypothetical protein